MGYAVKKDKTGPSLCAHCGAEADPSWLWCPYCNVALKDAAFGQGNSTNLSGANPEIFETKAGKKGKKKRRGRTGTSPEARRAYLDHLTDNGATVRMIRSAGGGGDWFADVADAERLCEQTEADVEAARGELQYARHQIDSGHLGERALTPEARTEYVHFLGAEGRWEQTVAAAERARAWLNTLLERSPPALSDSEPGPPRAAVFKAKPDQLQDDPDYLDYGAW